MKVYEKAQVAMVRPTYTDLVDLQVGYTEGDRTGHLHVGYNQKLFIGEDNSILLTLSSYIKLFFSKVLNYNIL